ncbi:MAG TPA: hypothetical protein VFE14_08230 [Micromonosporaceae bacterium]|nr:hypothetical protein [Micromonosporaceae bacterium]
MLAPLVPAGLIALVITGLVYAGSARRAKRYRPGRSFDFTPVWFLSAPEQLNGRVDAPAGLASAAAGAALPAAAGAALPASAAAGAALPAGALTDQIAETGGASDRW